MTEAKVTIRKDHKDGSYTLYRAWQPLKKNGQPAKRQPRISGGSLVVYAGGGYRYYDSTKVLARECVSKDQIERETYIDPREFRRALRAERQNMQRQGW